MSSIESMVSEIEEDYHRILHSLETKVKTDDPTCLFEKVSEEYMVKRLRDVMKLQRKIESSVESVKGLAKHTKFAKRMTEVADSLLGKLSEKNEIDSKKFLLIGQVGTLKMSAIGVIPSLTEAHNSYVRHETTMFRRYCYLAYFVLKLAMPTLIELEEEFRLIGALTTYPINKKIRLKHSLIINDFEGVAVSLEEAESNVETEHFKDCVSRCRDAVEIFIALVREKETGDKTEKRFSADLGKILKIGVFDEATGKLAQGVYSFLSLKGSHKYDVKKVLIYDAETALKESYSLLEMLLKRYDDFRKAQKREKQG